MSAPLSCREKVEVAEAWEARAADLLERQAGEGGDTQLGRPLLGGCPAAAALCSLTGVHDCHCCVVLLPPSSSIVYTASTPRNPTRAQRAWRRGAAPRWTL